ncbi:AbrB/MazE/SpoVT family DNA-binding domain-containing protein [Thermococcus indicus]|uniref:AbrB/MazE/SpoVT family DNA-binding domain-containing protein n=1 Tax=Thermococcus indicus TaxID=2586643 RepID=A0A4Y5SNB8_9EURY|nr:AbrB/MazE/SpoVT family DNA-binding domain-containing protein [Thermococcus indicus]
MVSIRLKVGPKGQIVIPKVFREAYGIKEGGEVIVEPTERGLIIMPKKSKEKLIEELLEWKHKRAKGKPAKLGELKGISLEDEFDEVWGIGE